MSVGDTFTIKTVQEYNKYFQAANRLGYALKSRELSDDRREITLVSK